MCVLRIACQGSHSFLQIKFRSCAYTRTYAWQELYTVVSLILPFPDPDLLKPPPCRAGATIVASGAIAEWPETGPSLRLAFTPLPIRCTRAPLLSCYFGVCSVVTITNRGALLWRDRRSDRFAGSCLCSTQVHLVPGRLLTLTLTTGPWPALQPRRFGWDPASVNPLMPLSPASHATSQQANALELCSPCVTQVPASTGKVDTRLALASAFNDASCS